MKRFAALIAAVTLLFNTFTTEVSADTLTSGIATAPKKIMLYLKPDITVEFNGIIQMFKDINGQTVYPIIYNGSTYLPVRAISAIMKEPIEWDAGSKTVFIGKTLTYPNRSGAPIPTGAAISVKEGAFASSALKPKVVTAFLRPDVLVMHDFVVQSFQDVNGNNIYPVIFNGSTYLPIRSISNLMNEPISWDGASQKVSIGNGKGEVEDPNEEPAGQVNAVAAILKDIFEREESLYYEATAKIASIKNSTSTEEKQVIAATASENYIRAQQMTAEAKSIDKTAFTDQENAAYEALVTFTESAEYYILVLENIAYLAASDSDYSMLADTFLYFAMESQTKMEKARVLIIQ